jgi:hypothetical protein
MNDNIHTLLERRLIDLNGAQFVALQRYAVETASPSSPAPAKEQAIGISALAEALACSVSQIYILQKEGVLEEAVISRIGRHIVFDVNKARAAANAWRENKRKPAEGQAS